MEEEAWAVRRPPAVSETRRHLGVDHHLEADEGGVAALGAELAVEGLLAREASRAPQHLRRAVERGEQEAWRGCPPRALGPRRAPMRTQCLIERNTIPSTDKSLSPICISTDCIA